MSPGAKSHHQLASPQELDGQECHLIPEDLHFEMTKEVAANMDVFRKYVLGFLEAFS